MKKNYLEGEGLKPVLNKFMVMMFFLKFWEISKQNSFTELLQGTASGVWNVGQNFKVSQSVLRKIKVLQKQPPEMFCKKCVLKSFTNFNQVAGPQGNYIKRRIQHRCFSVNNAEFWNTCFEEHLHKAASCVL